MKSVFTSLILILVLNALPAHAIMCVDYFTETPSRRSTELFPMRPLEAPKASFPNSVWFKIPEKAIQINGLDVADSLTVLQPILNKLTFDINADLNLPGGNQKTVQLDIDVAEIGTHEGSIVGKLGATFKTPPSKDLNEVNPPDNFFENNESVNSMLALHLSLINEGIKSSLGDMNQNPFRINVDGKDYKITQSPTLSAVNSSRPNRVLVRVGAAIPLSSVTMLAGAAFKGDIKASVSLEAEFVVGKDNTVSLKLIGVHKEDFELSTETQRFSSSIVRKAINMFASREIDKFNNKLLRDPYMVENLFKLPELVNGTHVQLYKIYLDMDGYLKVQLHLEAPKPKAESKIKVKIRLKD